MMKSFAAAAIAAGLVAFTTSFALADSDYEYGKQMPALIKEMPKAKVPLADGIKDAEKGGKAISAQYEVDDGTYQLSVFVAKGSDASSVSEVIVDYATGAIKTSDKLSDPDDIKDAKKQLAAMAKAKTSLSDAVAAAVKANPGFEAIRVVPKLSGGEASAQITLLQGGKPKKVVEKL
jgi:hypothetical protein